MSTVNLELDEGLVDILSELRQPVSTAVLELIVLELYRLGKLSSGRAAELVGMSRADFIRRASDLGIPYLRVNEQELDDEIRLGRSL
jgi:predicted HTH domain antitoxin